ncbi:MAG TPA: FMN-binding negative transcriptional regulator [Planctomycetaceae bacterium]|nr:FMN-binding negative transcriptional regulator [Planctomycetaceae bacterium]
MYNPASFVQHDLPTLHSFIAHHSFATLISQSADGPGVSHLPLLLDCARNCLLGHVARANPHWQSLDGQPVLAIFHGPHAYVSPAWYEVPNTVPTWNYAVVHVRGLCRIIQEEEGERAREILERTVQTFEAGRPNPWSIDDVESGFLDKLISSIVAFTIAIEEIEGKWKLNQNHDEPRRRRVIAQLNLKSDDNSRGIARLMSDTLES